LVESSVAVSVLAAWLMAAILVVEACLRSLEVWPVIEEIISF
jgi:hypothetical protein